MAIVESNARKWSYYMRRTHVLYASTFIETLQFRIYQISRSWKIWEIFFLPIFIQILAAPYAMMLIKNKWVSDTGKFGFNYFSAIFGEKVYVTGKLIKINPMDGYLMDGYG